MVVSTPSFCRTPNPNTAVYSITTNTAAAARITSPAVLPGFCGMFRKRPRIIQYWA